MFREAEIMKDLAFMNKIGSQNFTVIEKHFRKMIRKILVLMLDKTVAGSNAGN